jgi:hypothetical protein
MKVKSHRLGIAFLVLASSSVAATNQTYTVKTPVWETTNAIAVIRNHAKKVPPCTLIRYVEGGRTNEFHAWACPVVVNNEQPESPPALARRKAA